MMNVIYPQGKSTARARSEWTTETWPEAMFDGSEQCFTVRGSTPTEHTEELIYKYIFA